MPASPATVSMEPASTLHSNLDCPVREDIYQQNLSLKQQDEFADALDDALGALEGLEGDENINEKGVQNVDDSDGVVKDLKGKDLIQGKDLK